MGGSAPRPDGEGPAGSNVSRRTVLAGGLLLVGGSSLLVESDTAARFSDGESASGDVRVATLNRTVVDASDSQTNTVEYRLSWQVLLDHGFDRVDVTVRNTATGNTTVYEDRAQDGAVTYTFGYGVDQHEYEFTFEVYVDGQADPVLTETVVDVADGSNPSDNDDLSGSDDPVLEGFVVHDRNGSRHETEYDVTWELSNADGFQGHVLVTFTNTQNGYGNEEIESPLDGSVSYPRDGPYSANWALYEISVEVVKDNGVVVASGSLTDDPDGTDAVYDG